MIAAAIIYVTIIQAGVTLEVTNAPPGYEWIEKTYYILFFSSFFFFFGNYMDVWRLFRLDRIKNRILKVICILLTFIMLLVMLILLTSAVEKAVGYK